VDLDSLDKRTFLRHTLATIAYRGGKAIRNAPPGFGDVRAGETTRSAVEIVSHLGDLFEWALSTVKGEHKWKNSPPRSWDAETDRFFDALQKLDDYLASGEPLAVPPEKLFQGPIADALTHIGQLATLRRLAGFPVRGENYLKADVVIGRVGRDQSAPEFEFD
jgi:hypothetical protein